MRELTLILTDLYVDGRPVAESVESAPRLTAFETALTRAALEGSDWREWICRRVNLQVNVQVAVAAIARFARPTSAENSPAGQWWLAQCAHLEAGVDRLYMSAALQSLGVDEWREVECGFNDTFSAFGYRLTDGHGAQAYLVSAADLEVKTVDPARVRGGDVLRALPEGRDAAGLKRLMTEIQMWLHDHPVNIAREERGDEPVNALWIWGGGLLPEYGAVSKLPALRSNDAFLNGLWKLKGGVRAGVPHSFDAIDLAADDAMVISLACAPGPGETPAQSMIALERAWFAPAVAALWRGQVSCLQVHANDRLFSLTRSGLWRFWRARRPWIEILT